jgi:heat shock protein HspQ
MPPFGAPPVDERGALTQGFAMRKLLLVRGGELPKLVLMTNGIISSATLDAGVPMPPVATANFTIGEVVRHRLFEFRGVVFDVDPVFANSQEWYDAIPEDVRPRKDQPFYHLLAENAESSYIAYVSQQNLISDDSDDPIDHPAIDGLFDGYTPGRYTLKREHRH